MKKEFSSKLNELEEQYTSLKDDLEHSARLDRDELRELTQHEISALRTEKTLLEAEVTALKQKFLDDNDSEDQVAQQLSIMVTETAGLTRILDEYRERISSKDKEITSLRRRVEEEQTISEEQLRAIKEELKSEIMSSDDYQNNLMEIERLHSQIADYERKREKDEEFEEERGQKERKLREENEKLKAQVRSLEEANQSGEVDALKSALTEKNSKLGTLEEELTKLKGLTPLKLQFTKFAMIIDENEMLHKESERNKNSNEALQNEVTALKNDNSDKTNQIESLHTRFETSQVDADEKLKHMRVEHEKTVEHLKQREADLKQQLEELREEISASQTSREESENFAVQLKEEVKQKAEMLHQMEKDLKEKKCLLLDKEQELEKMEAEICSLEEKMKADKDHYEEELRKLQMSGRMEQEHEEKT
ncbi:hypothetical protein TELCIR_12222 [Teladorsagia circumcincta]|uniref:M protein repeat protein n=1 Tax=Teladorsagia circumcincta TaxID=45464 RepID=A0A2G9U9B2_TELCI|nr:hypothetical protein TELCIR_12222 [Teladorsagia circumcincta]